jgi:hypothetical protein
VNPEKTKYMLISRCQKAGRGQSIKIVNRSYEDMTKLKYSGTTLTDEHSKHEEIKSMMFRAVFWVVLPCKMIVDRRFRGTCCLHHQKRFVSRKILHITQ